MRRWRVSTEKKKTDNVLRESSASFKPIKVNVRGERKKKTCEKKKLRKEKEKKKFSQKSRKNPDEKKSVVTDRRCRRFLMRRAA